MKKILMAGLLLAGTSACVVEPAPRAAYYGEPYYATPTYVGGYYRVAPEYYGHRQRNDNWRYWNHDRDDHERGNRDHDHDRGSDHRR